jgi:hypothetical protein
MLAKIAEQSRLKQSTRKYDDFEAELSELI